MAFPFFCPLLGQAFFFLLLTLDPNKLPFAILFDRCGRRWKRRNGCELGAPLQCVKSDFLSRSVLDLDWDLFCGNEGTSISTEWR